MATTTLPNVKPDQPEIEEWPTLDQDPADAKRDERDAHSIDATQGRQLGSNPYDDATQAR